MPNRSKFLILTAALLALTAVAQDPIQAPAPQIPQTGLPGSGIRPTYVLGAGDQIVIRATDFDDITDRPVTVDQEGNITLPTLGEVRAAGLTVQELEADLVRRLRMFVVAPQVNIQVTQYRTEPVFFVGAFQRPGIYPLLGRRTLVEMLTSIGGLQPNASRRIKVTRRLEIGEIPLENAIQDPVNGLTTVEISLGSLTENVNPAEDIVLQPYDVIAVERAELVYVNGGFARVGAFELGERESMSVAQVLSLAGGLTTNANRKEARVLRRIAGTSRRAEIPIDLDAILSGKANDFPLHSNDLLYVPVRSVNPIWSRVGLIALGVIPTLVTLAFTRF